MGTLWYNGNFYTMAKLGEAITAVFVKNGIIEAIGEQSELEQQYKNEITESIDVKGATVFPGFVDSHLHMIGHGEKIIRLDLSSVMSSLEMKEQLQQKVSHSQSDEWIIGEGWNENNFSDRKIFHRTELDEISPNKPMMLTRVCRHAVLVNSQALSLANITSETPDPPGGIIVKDDMGEPTGYLLDEAQELVKAVVPKVSDEYLRQALRSSVDDMLQRGLVGGHTEDLNYYGSYERVLNTFQSVIDGKKTKFRAHLLVHHEVALDMCKQELCRTQLSPFIETGAMKIFADGALGGRTALLSKPYNDAPETSGVAIHTQEQLNQLVKTAREHQMAVAIHTIGDLSLEMAVCAIETYPLVENGLRDRIIHLQVGRKDLLERLKKLPVIIDIQPRFVASDFPWVEERLGEERLPLSFAWKTLLDEGLACAGGSDAPIEPVDPLLGIHAAVTRKKPGDHHDGYNTNEKLTLFEAISLFTGGSAYAIGKENTMGKLLPGYVADFTMFDRDLFTLHDDELLDAKVVKTVVDNEIMYEG
ncbi:amidohydrolase [Alkalihalobacterium bogoriense]|uniref:amidohydrolase n=1 Tax=Alkalihalobacterium bogoriense TaxID=246272 RepID=UPI00047B0378|nr:amidohydrolase [Alkalihalobacterium bogoriense]